MANRAQVVAVVVAVDAEIAVVVAVGTAAAIDAAVAADIAVVAAAVDRIHLREAIGASLLNNNLGGQMKKNHTVFGAGPEWTERLHDDLMDNFVAFKCFELIPENFVDHPDRTELLALLKQASTPVLIHSVGLSLGTDEPLKEKHLDKVLAVGEQVNMVNFSDHLSMTESGGIEIGQLTPIPWSVKAADVVIKKIEKIQKRIKVPFALEHTAHKFFYPVSELTEPEFINRILDRTGCELMLDLHNVHCNSVNAGYDPHAWLTAVQLHRVSSIHLAGGYVDKYGTIQDGHDNAVPEAVWDLLDFVLQRIIPEALIVERTNNYPGFESLMAEVNRADVALTRALAEKPQSEQEMRSAS